MTTPHPNAPIAFSVSHADGGAGFEQGLREFFAYRDLGIADATTGRTVAHLIRAVKGTESTGAWHRHRCDFQLVLVIRGWMEFEYEGVGLVRMEPGTCVNQPPGIVHRELRHGEDLEMLELVQPAEFVTENCAAPGGDPLEP